MSQRKDYNTKARSKILDYIKNNSQLTLCASDIIDYMKNSGYSVNQTTVYRYLDKLCSEHIIVKYPDSTGEKSIYQYVGKDEECINHLHLKCIKCKKLIHMDCSFLDEFSHHLQENHDFNIDFKGNMLYGVCKECSKKNNTK